MGRSLAFKHGKQDSKPTPAAAVDMDLRGYQDMGKLVAETDNICISHDNSNLTSVLPYSRPLLPKILSISHSHKDVCPFRQHIQLLGPNTCTVRSTAQVDNGAICNCTGLHIWTAYGLCLGDLTPTRMRVSVANNVKVQCAGTWSGLVCIGGTELLTQFLVFKCNRAFDVILGKPWLHEVCAIHNYITDIIEIDSGTEGTTRVTIDNMEDKEKPTPLRPTIENTNELPEDEEQHQEHNTPITAISLPQEKSLDKLIEEEYQRTVKLQSTEGQFAETR